MKSPTTYGISWADSEMLVVIGSLEEAEAHARAAIVAGNEVQVVKVVIVSTYKPVVAS